MWNFILRDKNSDRPTFEYRDACAKDTRTRHAREKQNKAEHGKRPGIGDRPTPGQLSRLKTNHPFPIRGNDGSNPASKTDSGPQFFISGIS